MADGIKTPIEAGLVARVAQGLKYMVTGRGPDEWFGPGQPPPPAAPEEVKGRAWDYPVGYNTTWSVRREGGITFAELRALAQNCDLVRLAIETRKDQLSRCSWVVRPKEGIEQADRQVKEATALLQRPDRVHTWRQWSRMLADDLLTIDAPAVYPRPTLGGGLYSLDIIDGATIKPVLDGSGRVPAPPAPAYQQILKGLPATEYTREELIYFPRNQLTWRVYGFSPVEQVSMIINLALRRQLHQLEYYRSGSIPEALGEVPADWSTEQIRDWQQYWDALHEGNLAERRKMRWVPGGMKPHWTKEAALKDEMDEWLARVICFAFAISPLPFIKMMNRATSDTAQQATQEEGLEPLKEWLADLINLILDLWKFDQVEFAWEEEVAVDPKVQAEIDDIHARAGIRRRSEIRESLGLEDDMVPDFIMTNTGPVVLDEIGKDNGSPAGTPAPPGTVAPASGPAGKGSPAGTPAPLAKTTGKKKVIKPIDRNRPEIVRLREKLAGIMAKALKATAPKAAAALAAAAGLAKVEDDAVTRLLAELDLSGITATMEEARAVLEAAAQSGGAAALAQINAESPALMEQVNQLAVEYAQERSAELVGKKWVEGRLIDNPDERFAIDAATRDYLRADVAQAVDEGWSTGQLAAKLEENYAFSDTRAETIARTEVARADVEGNLAAYRESGQVSGKEWLLGSEHGDAADECDENEAEGVIPLDQAFSSGDAGPPAHPNCTCDVLPVLSEDQGPEGEAA